MNSVRGDGTVFRQQTNVVLVSGGPVSPAVPATPTPSATVEATATPVETTTPTGTPEATPTETITPEPTPTEPPLPTETPAFDDATPEPSTP